MTTPTARRAFSSQSLSSFRLAAVALACTLAALTGCGGGGNPLDNADTLENPTNTGGRRLSFLYFQYCVAPVFNAALESHITNEATGVVTTTINTCSSSGCHAPGSTGGSLTLVPNAPVRAYPATGPLPQADIDALRNPSSPEAIYRNFISAQAAVVIGSPTQSALLNKPLVRNVLHGGGVVFETPTDANARIFQYWLQRPMPEGQDEFSRSLESTMFVGGVASTTTCVSN